MYVYISMQKQNSPFASLFLYLHHYLLAVFWRLSPVTHVGKTLGKLPSQLSGYLGPPSVLDQLGAFA